MFRKQCVKVWDAEKKSYDADATWLENSLLTDIHHQAAIVRDYYFRDPLVDIAEQLIGPNIKGATSQLTFKMRGNTKPFAWHQDNGYGEFIFNRCVSDSRRLIYLRPEVENQIFVGWRECDLVKSLDDIKRVDQENYKQTMNNPTLQKMRDGLSGTFSAMKERISTGPMPVFTIGPMTRCLSLTLQKRLRASTLRWAAAAAG